MNHTTYMQLLESARSICARADDAEDLLQDALLVAIQQSRYPLKLPVDRAWLRGVMRKLAAHGARAATRRRARDDAWSRAVVASADNRAYTDVSDLSGGGPDPLAGLPAAARQVAVLVLHGLSAKEIRWILDLTDTAFRQRLTRIRRHLGQLPAELRGDAIALARASRAADTTLAIGLIRRALVAELRRAPGIGTHDPDGHLLVFRAPTAHKSGGRGNYEDADPASKGDESC
jgi:DNA-directed RNA polymerase specialized sigma24 family protein